RSQQTSGFEVLLELGDPITGQRVDRRGVDVTRRHTVKDAVEADIRENGVGQARAEYRVQVRCQIEPCAVWEEGRVADEHEVQIGAGDAVCFEPAHGNRLGSGALRVSEDGQRVVRAESR